MVMVEPHLDCVAQGRLGDVGLLHGGEGVVALAGEGVDLGKVGPVRLGDTGPGASCS